MEGAASDLTHANSPGVVIARGAGPFVLAPLLAMVPFAALALLLEDPVWSYVSFPLGIAFVFGLMFFRDPYRELGKGIVSPADGRVLTADPAKATLTVVMSVLNVHVNRSPLAGRVVSMEHTPGTHAPAASSRTSRNERVETVLETSLGPLRLTQVAGVFARRIVPYVGPGDTVRKGQRIGIIRFGSRVELSLPGGAILSVREGDKVRAGTTTIAEPGP